MDRGAWRATIHGVIEGVRHDLETKQQQGHSGGPPNTGCDSSHGDLPTRAGHQGSSSGIQSSYCSFIHKRIDWLPLWLKAVSRLADNTTGNFHLNHMTGLSGMGRPHPKVQCHQPSSEEGHFIRSEGEHLQEAKGNGKNFSGVQAIHALLQQNKHMPSIWRRQCEVGGS